MSTGECRGCKLVGNMYEGCDITTGLPICDADLDTVAVDWTDYSNAIHNARCAACTKKGKHKYENCFMKTMDSAKRKQRFHFDAHRNNKIIFRWIHW